MLENGEITVAGLSYSYPNGHRALEDLNFRVGRGEKLVLLGPNGSGKSTLLLLLAGLLTGGEQRGKIVRSVAAASAAFLFQNPEDQMIATTVEDDLAFALLRDRLEPVVVRARVGEALRQVHLEGYEDRSPLELSFGEKKRVGLAGCLIARPEMIFLDEPALGLDPRETGQLLKILRELPTTIIFSSMDFGLAQTLADRALLLDRGRVIAEGEPGKLLSDRELLRQHGLATD